MLDYQRDLLKNPEKYITPPPSTIIRKNMVPTLIQTSEIDDETFEKLQIDKTQTGSSLNLYSKSNDGRNIISLQKFNTNLSTNNNEKDEIFYTIYFDSTETDIQTTELTENGDENTNDIHTQEYSINFGNKKTTIKVSANSYFDGFIFENDCLKVLSIDVSEAIGDTQYIQEIPYDENFRLNSLIKYLLVRNGYFEVKFYNNEIKKIPIEYIFSKNPEKITEYYRYSKDLKRNIYEFLNFQTLFNHSANNLIIEDPDSSNFYLLYIGVQENNDVKTIYDTQTKYDLHLFCDLYWLLRAYNNQRENKNYIITHNDSDSTYYITDTKTNTNICKLDDFEVKNTKKYINPKSVTKVNQLQFYTDCTYYDDNIDDLIQFNEENYEDHWLYTYNGTKDEPKMGKIKDLFDNLYLRIIKIINNDKTIYYSCTDENLENNKKYLFMYFANVKDVENIENVFSINVNNDNSNNFDVITLINSNKKNLVVNKTGKATSSTDNFGFNNVYKSLTKEELILEPFFFDNITTYNHFAISDNKQYPLTLGLNMYEYYDNLLTYFTNDNKNLKIKLTSNAVFTHSNDKIIMNYDTENMFYITLKAVNDTEQEIKIDVSFLITLNLVDVRLKVKDENYINIINYTETTIDGYKITNDTTNHVITITNGADSNPITYYKITKDSNNNYYVNVNLSANNNYLELSKELSGTNYVMHYDLKKIQSLNILLLTNKVAYYNNNNNNLQIITKKYTQTLSYKENQITNTIKCDNSNYLTELLSYSSDDNENIVLSFKNTEDVSISTSMIITIYNELKILRNDKLLYYIDSGSLTIHTDIKIYDIISTSVVLSQTNIITQTSNIDCETKLLFTVLNAFTLNPLVSNIKECYVLNENCTTPKAIYDELDPDDNLIVKLTNINNVDCSIINTENRKYDRYITPLTVTNNNTLNYIIKPFKTSFSLDTLSSITKTDYQNLIEYFNKIKNNDKITAADKQLISSLISKYKLSNNPNKKYLDYEMSEITIIPLCNSYNCYVPKDKPEGSPLNEEYNKIELKYPYLKNSCIEDFKVNKKNNSIIFSHYKNSKRSVNIEDVIVSILKKI